MPYREFFDAHWEGSGSGDVSPSQVFCAGIDVDTTYPATFAGGAYSGHLFTFKHSDNKCHVMPENARYEDLAGGACAAWDITNLRLDSRYIFSGQFAHGLSAPAFYGYADNGLGACQYFAPPRKITQETGALQSLERSCQTLYGAADVCYDNTGAVVACPGGGGPPAGGWRFGTPTWSNINSPFTSDTPGACVQSVQGPGGVTGNYWVGCPVGLGEDTRARYAATYAVDVLSGYLGTSTRSQRESGVVDQFGNPRFQSLVVNNWATGAVTLTNRAGCYEAEVLYNCPTYTSGSWAAGCPDVPQNPVCGNITDHINNVYYPYGAQATGWVFDPNYLPAQPYHTGPVCYREAGVIPYSHAGQYGRSRYGESYGNASVRRSGVIDRFVIEENLVSGSTYSFDIVYYRSRDSGRTFDGRQVLHSTGTNGSAGMHALIGHVLDEVGGMAYCVYFKGDTALGDMGEWRLVSLEETTPYTWTFRGDTLIVRGEKTNGYLYRGNDGNYYFSYWSETGYLSFVTAQNIAKDGTATWEGPYALIDGEAGGYYQGAVYVDKETGLHVCVMEHEPTTTKRYVHDPTSPTIYTHVIMAERSNGSFTFKPAVQANVLLLSTEIVKKLSAGHYETGDKDGPANATRKLNADGNGTWTLAY